MVHKNKEMVTIKDVADLANVTAQTVSRVMRGTGYVSEETKAKVLQAAHQLNYIPSYVAKALRKGMSQSIAIVFDSLRNVYFSVMIDYIRKSIKNSGYSVQLLFSNESVITEETYRKAISHGAVGVISFLEGKEGIGSVVKNLGVPMLIFGRSTYEDGLDYITTDDVQGGMLAANRLINDGCTSFYYIVEGRGMTCAIDRYKGFKEELEMHGHKAELLDLNEEGEKCFAKMSLDDPAQGIFCFSDNIAFNVVKKMKGIPDANRAKLIGYDNIQSDIPLPITLTTIGVDKEHHADFAVKQIIEKISDPQIKLAKHQSVKLFEGETA